MTPSPKPRTDIRTAIVSFLAAAVVMIPALVAYIEAKTESIKSKMAVEKATSDLTYEQLAERANKSEDDRRKLMLEVAKLREVAIEHHPEDVATSSSAPTVAKALAEIRSPVAPLPSSRPAPPPAAVQAAERAIEAQ